MKSDFEIIKLDVPFKKLFVLNNELKYIVYERRNRIEIASINESYKLINNIIMIEKSNFGFNQNNQRIIVIDYTLIKDDKICALCSKALNLYYLKSSEYFIIIKSLINQNYYEIPLNYNNQGLLEIKFYKKRNQLIIIGDKILSFWKYIESSGRYQFFSQIKFDTNFKIKILNKNIIIISTNECLLLLDSNSFKIKREIFYNDEEENNEEEEIGEFEGNYEYDEEDIIYNTQQEREIKICFSNDKKYLAISNNWGRLLIYDTKNFYKQKIKKYENYNIFKIPSHLNQEKEFKKINTILISDIYAVNDYFVLKIRYATKLYGRKA